ncbi:Leucine-rich repeat-containing 40 [Chlorella sorokiniana]|uniref:Leucine-rich repeat-containing 40 n=1 Tax=Chlorella sorokiniana TaxID=3076 RepID=A0A2P6TRJ4_CHLSO|nr:Leucine-rich repeat-containing 40 [Chlorella sorokiniana]|eukprot:PRW56681.1 Leucine-rich repeat-containing 40 [Chlorella sorokiniana]
MRTRRAARAAGPGDALSALPDDLLELCMPCTRDFDWPLGTLRLVCKRWKRIFDSSALLTRPSCAQLAAASGLTSLRVGDFQYEVPDELWSSVACMPALANLEIEVHTGMGTTVAIGSRARECLAACTQLARLKLAEGYVEGSGDEPGEFALLPGATRLSALRELELHGNVSSLGDLWQHTGLTRLVLLDSIDSYPAAPDGSGSSLPALLQAELGTDQRHIELPEQHRLFAALNNVTRLTLRSATEWLDDSDDVHYNALHGLSQLERLRSLELTGRLKSIPDTVRGLTSLKLLNVTEFGLRQLPEGPYLLGLRTLLMQGHRMRRLPPALSTARSLEVLDAMPSVDSLLWNARAGSPLLLLQPDDLSLLAALPALRLLCLPMHQKLFQHRKDDPRQQAAAIQQVLLSAAFCALLPQLAVVSSCAAQAPALFQEPAFEGGLRPDKLREVQEATQLVWVGLGQERQQGMLGVLRRAAEAGELSPQAVALLEAYPPQPAGQSSQAGWRSWPVD